MEVVDKTVPDLEVVEAPLFDAEPMLFEGFEPAQDTRKRKPIPTDAPRRCQENEIWRIGDQHLLVADCRNVASVVDLFGGARAKLTITSPPYADRRSYDEGSGFVPIPADQYVNWFEDVEKTIAAVTDDAGSFCLNIRAHAKDGFRTLYVYDLILAMCRRWGWGLVDDMVWRRPGNPGSWPNRLKNDWEGVYHFCRQAKLAEFHPEAAGVPSARCIANGVRRKRGTGTSFGAPEERRDGLAHPSNVLATQVSSESWHEAAYPVDLPEFFIKLFTKPGDEVFDPFSGSGTTLLACQTLGRRGYGVELSAAYADVALHRIEKELGLTPVLCRRLE